MYTVKQNIPRPHRRRNAQDHKNKTPAVAEPSPAVTYETVHFIAHRYVVGKWSCSHSGRLIRQRQKAFLYITTINTAYFV